MTPDDIDKLVADLKAARLRLGSQAKAVRAYRGEVVAAGQVVGLLHLSRLLGWSRSGIVNALQALQSTPATTSLPTPALNAPPAPAASPNADAMKQALAKLGIAPKDATDAQSQD